MRKLSARYTPPPISPSPTSPYGEVVTEEFLSCKVCYKGLINPRILRCLHTCCHSCIANLVKQVNPLKAIVVCPVCQVATRLDAEGVEGLPSNTLVLRLAKSISADLGSGLSCTCCQFDNITSEAKYRCINCKDYLCAGCNHIHRKTRITRSHTIIELSSIKEIVSRQQDTDEKSEGVEAEGSKINEEPSTCGHLPLEWYDETCRMVVCGQCISCEEHGGHKIERYTKMIQKIKHGLSKTIPDLERRFPSINNSIDNAEIALEESKHVGKTLLANLKDHMQAVREEIDNREKEITMKIMEHIKSNDKMLRMACADTKNSRSTYVIAYQFVNQLLTYGIDEEVLRLQDWVTGRLQQLQCIKITENIQTNQMQINFPSKITDVVENLCGKITTTQIIARPVMVTHTFIELNRHQDWISGFTVNNATKSLCVSVSSIKEGANRLLILNTRSKSKTKVITKQLTGICQTREGNIVTVEKPESKVKMYTRQGQLIRSFKCLSSGGVAVNSEGHIVIAGQNAVHVYRRNGELLNTIADKPTRKQESPMTCKQICINQQSGDIIVTDSQDSTVRCYYTTGHLKFTYNTNSQDKDESSCPEGLCIDKQGNIMIADSVKHRIHMITSGGAFINYAVGPTDALNHPRFVQINEDGYLVVADQSGNIQTFMYL